MNLIKVIVPGICFLSMHVLTFMTKLDACVVIVPYDPKWAIWYEAESRLIREAFDSKRIMAIEHFGSTSVRGLSAKPVVDILVGLNRFEVTESEKKALADLGYIFIEQSSYCQRFYFKKQGERSFNLSLVLFSGATWHDCIDVRDYLRASPTEAHNYVLIKQAAISNGCTKISEYSKYKFKFIKTLLANAKSWRCSTK
jgi:GrpB-like predicted nucleotidyltransferase (UPF0157 family)